MNIKEFNFKLTVFVFDRTTNYVLTENTCVTVPVIGGGVKEIMTWYMYIINVYKRKNRSSCVDSIKTKSVLSEQNVPQLNLYISFTNSFKKISRLYRFGLPT